MDDLGFNIFIAFCMVLLGTLLGSILCGNYEIKIQEIKPVENGYYITINDEIYYKEV